MKELRKTVLIQAEETYKNILQNGLPSLDLIDLKRIRFLEVLLEDLKHENIFSIDLRNL